jgi:integrase/recombinase XerD
MNSLRKFLEEYLAMRRGLGFKLRNTARALEEFIHFMEERRAAHITLPLSIEWAQQPKNAQPDTWAMRLAFVRGFARFVAASDASTEVPPPSLLPRRPARASPYIYSSHEIADLMNSALKLRSSSGMKGRSYYVLFGLLAVTGMRIGEVLRLKVNDIDLNEGVVTVRNSKFGKSRLIPFHRSTRCILSRYVNWRKPIVNIHPCEYLLISDNGYRLHGADVLRTFHALSRKTGLRSPSATRGPRLHDFRHRFAVETLSRWYRNNADVEARLPRLSAYLGHIAVCNTYWYLSATPQLLAMAARRIECRGGDL